MSDDTPDATPRLWTGDTGRLHDQSRRALLRLLQGPYLSGRAQPQLWSALVADEAAEVLERRVIGDAGAEELGAVVVEHGLRSVPVDRFDLGEVLPDRDERDAVASSSGRVAG